MSAERTKEDSVKDRVKKVLRLRNVQFDMPATHGYGKSGNFDFVCCVRGLYLGIETKRDGNELPTQLQTEHAMAVMEAGGVALLIHDGNVGLVAATIDAMKSNGSAPSWWPSPKPQAPDTAPPVLKRKKT
jgi:hypothetical protein